MNKQTIITILLALVTTTPVLAQNLIKTATAPVSFSKRDFADTIKIKVIDGAVYAFNDIGYELAPHSTRLFTIHVEPDKYDFERGLEYRIAKEFFKSGQNNPQSVYCNFTIE